MRPVPFEKACVHCGVVKPAKDFSRHSRYGLQSWCKECTKSYVRGRPLTPYGREAKRARDKKRRELHPHAEYSEADRLYKIEQRRQFPEKQIARSAVAIAIRRGRLERDKCQKCGSSVWVDAHHPDYSKPLDVVWLCRKCHAEEHNTLRRAANDLQPIV